MFKKAKMIYRKSSQNRRSLIIGGEIIWITTRLYFSFVSAVEKNIAGEIRVGEKGSPLGYLSVTISASGRLNKFKRELRNLKNGFMLPELEEEWRKKVSEECEKILEEQLDEIKLV